MSKKYVNPLDFIKPLNINGLEVRYIYIPARSKRNKSNLLVVYDFESNIEKWFGFLIALSRYTNVTMVDLPGFGGADSLFKINLKPNLENMTNYLSTIIKLKYRRKKLNILGIGFGFTLVTKMIEDYPDIASKINNVISINGYVHKDDFNFKAIDKFVLYFNYFISQVKILSNLKDILLKNNLYLSKKFDQDYFKLYPKTTFPYLAQFTQDLYRETDLRTLSYLKYQQLKLDLCRLSRIEIPMWQFNINPPKYLNTRRIEQHLKIVYSSYHHLSLNIRKLPFVINQEKIGLKMIPNKLKNILHK